MRKVGGEGWGGGGELGEAMPAVTVPKVLTKKINKKSTTFMKESLKQEHRHITIRFYFLFYSHLGRNEQIPIAFESSVTYELSISTLDLLPISYHKFMETKPFRKKLGFH